MLHPVIDGVAEFLLAPEVTLGSLDGDVPKQELDLVQFAAGQVAESCAGAAPMPARDAASGTTSHSTFGVIPLPRLGRPC